MEKELTKENYYGLGQVPKGIGAVLDGWNILEDDYTDPEIARRVVDLRVMTSQCLHNCLMCFTDKGQIHCGDATKTLSLQEITSLIDELSTMNIKAVNFLGEGEPTLDKHFFEILEYTKSKGIQPVIFTDAATKLRDIDFVKRLKEIGATICPKCDSLRNADYQNQVVGDKTSTFFDQRNEAIKLLIQEGFNDVREDGTTRMGHDMVVNKKNIHEVEKTLRYCRENNIRVVFTTYLPAGRSGIENFDKENTLSESEKQELSLLVQRIDKEYGFDHKQFNNFFTSPCLEFIQVCGNGDVTPCPGNDEVIGNIKQENITAIRARILQKFPGHDCNNFDGNCLYRP